MEPPIRLPDYLFPTGDGKNRDEVFLVEYDDILQSSMEAVIYGLLLMPTDRVNFPAIDEIDVIDPAELYYSMAMLDPKSFLLTVRKDASITGEYIDDVIARAHKINTWSNRSRLMMLYALVNLASTHYVKRIDIINQRGLEDFELKELEVLFGFDNMAKVNFYEGTISSILEDRPEYTTVYMRSTPELINIARNPEQFHLNGKLLLLRNSSENIEFKESEDGKLHPVELFNEQFIQLSEGRPWNIGRFYSKLFEPPENYEGGIW